jgi:hypothetical protein
MEELSSRRPGSKSKQTLDFSKFYLISDRFQDGCGGKFGSWIDSRMDVEGHLAVGSWM